MEQLALLCAGDFADDSGMARTKADEPRMNSKLVPLRTQLTALKRRRAAVRWGGAMCAVLLAALGCWAVAFLGDWSLRWSFSWRLAVLCGWFVALMWAAYKYARPAFAARESLEDLALFVERQHGIDSDLIAALQFDAAKTVVGSQTLSAAVIDRAAKLTNGIDVFEGFTYAHLPRRLAALMIALLAIAMTAVAFPEQTKSFWNRFWLGMARYPSQTQITELTINGQAIPVIASRQLPLRLAQGTTLSIHATARGQLPAVGTVRLIQRNTRAETQFELRPVSGAAAGTFAAEYALPANDVDLDVSLGDTWADRVVIHVMPLPIIDVEWRAIPPKYAAGAVDLATESHRAPTVLEGSELQLTVRGSNKELARVELRLDDEVFSLSSSGERPQAVWRLPADTPLSSVRRDWRYEIHAVDRDQLSVTPPITGVIRIKGDRLPRVTAKMATKLVVPTAKPRLAFHAVDDFGISQVDAVIEVRREHAEPQTHRQLLKQAPESETPLAEVRDEVRLDLAPYQLMPGDELRVTVEVRDARGELPPQVGSSAPLMLKVTDRGGILVGLLEADEHAIKQLETIIHRELGLGGEP